MKVFFSMFHRYLSYTVVVFGDSICPIRRRTDEASRNALPFLYRFVIFICWMKWAPYPQRPRLRLFERTYEKNEQHWIGKNEKEKKLFLLVTPQSFVPSWIIIIRVECRWKRLTETPITVVRAENARTTDSCGTFIMFQKVWRAPCLCNGAAWRTQKWTTR